MILRNCRKYFSTDTDNPPVEKVHKVKGEWEIAFTGDGDCSAEAHHPNRLRIEFHTLNVRAFPPSARNAVWSAGIVGQGEAYWKVTLEEGNKNPVEIGLTDRFKFSTMKGWKCLALVYEHGNLRDGTFSGNNAQVTKEGRVIKRGRLVDEFGPALKIGDTFGILCKATKDNLKVAFDVNGKSLGVAFDVPRETLGNEILPFIRLLDTCVLSIATSYVAEEFPSLEREIEKEEGIEGRWAYEDGAIPKPSFPVKLRFYKQEHKENTYVGVLRALNTQNFKLKRREDGTWKTSGGITTLIGGSPEEMQADVDFANLLEPRELYLNASGDTLTTMGVDGSGRLIWKRFSFTPDIVTENPFTPLPPK